MFHNIIENDFPIKYTDKQPCINKMNVLYYSFSFANTHELSFDLKKATKMLQFAKLHYYNK